LQSLRITAVEDRPLDGGVLLVERLSDDSEDLFGWAAEGLSAALEAQQAVGAVLDLNRARRALTMSQERFGRLSDEFLDFTSFERITELIRFGRKHRGEWRAWIKSVKDGSSQCEAPMREVRDALAITWEELAERLGTTSVSVQTTNIGQQIATGGAEIKESPRSGLT
jgi:DNA-binding transcriptional regulator YiaG